METQQEKTASRKWMFNINVIHKSKQSPSLSDKYRLFGCIHASNFRLGPGLNLPGTRVSACLLVVVNLRVSDQKRGTGGFDALGRCGIQGATICFESCRTRLSRLFPLVAYIDEAPELRKYVLRSYLPGVVGKPSVNGDQLSTGSAGGYPPISACFLRVSNSSTCRTEL